jgi:hypothetical protein
MRFQWPNRRTWSREPVTGISARLNKAMADHIVTAQGDGLRRATGSVPQPSDDPARERWGRLAWSAFDAHRKALLGSGRDAVVDPAVPILYFGDRDAYLSSPWRIITVGLNPSRAEFPQDDTFKRFPLARGLVEGNDDYLAALDTYFKTDPYKSWFSSYEALLNGLDASYYPGARSTALQTDLCSPVATDPTWTKLSRDTRHGLMSDGVVLWHELVRELRPDVILVSIARAHLAKIEFEASESFEISRLEEEGRARPYVTEGRWLDLDGHRSLMVFGQAAHRPFGLVSNMAKLGIGGRIATHLRRRDDVAEAGLPDQSLTAGV